MSRELLQQKVCAVRQGDTSLALRREGCRDTPCVCASGVHALCVARRLTHGGRTGHASVRRDLPGPPMSYGRRDGLSRSRGSAPRGAHAPDTALFSAVSAPLAHPLSGSWACLSTLSLLLPSIGWVMTGGPHDARGRTGALS